MNKMSKGRIMLALGVGILLLCGVFVSLDASLVTTYRGYPIYYEQESHYYTISGLGGLYDYVSDAKDAIDDYLGPPAPTNSAPHAECGGPYSGKTGKTIYFYSTGSYDPDGDSLSKKWSFGDGGTSTSSSPGHTYSSPGTYTVKLTVTDPGGLSNTDSTSCTVTVPYEPPPPPPPNERPTADVGGPYSGKVGVSITFNGGGSHDPDGSISGFIWNFGDGSTSNGGTTVHTYSVAGTYTVSLKVVDDDGASDTDTTTCVVSDIEQPSGDFTINGETVTKTDTITLKTLDLNITFTGKVNPSYITEVNIQVIQDDENIISKALLKDGTSTWSGTLTLPDEGEYTIEGFISYSGNSMRLMSITTASEGGIPQIAIIGFAVAIVAIGIIEMSKGKHRDA